MLFLFNQMIHETLQRRDNDSLEWCFVWQSLKHGAIISSIPGTGMFYLFLFLLSLFQWIAPGWWSPTVDLFYCHPPSQSMIAFTEILPVLCAAWFEVYHLIIRLQSFFLRWFTGTIILREILLVFILKLSFLFLLPHGTSYGVRKVFTSDALTMLPKLNCGQTKLFKILLYLLKTYTNKNHYVCCNLGLLK